MNKIYYLNPSEIDADYRGTCAMCNNRAKYVGYYKYKEISLSEFPVVIVCSENCYIAWCLVKKDNNIWEKWNG